MWGVVNEGGTAGASKLADGEFCGKTGTAQVISLDGRQRAGKQAALKNNAWFVGFAPRRNPEIVVAVLVQGGGYGAESAAPIVRDVVKAYYDKKQGVPPEELTTKALSPGSVLPGAVARSAEGGALTAKQPQPAGKSDVKPLPTAAIIPT